MERNPQFIRREAEKRERTKVTRRMAEQTDTSFHEEVGGMDRNPTLQ